MKVVLRREVPELGQIGEVKEVADGYARNYLIPRGFAIAATTGALAAVEARKGAERRQRERVDEERHALAQQLEGTTVVIHARAGARGRLHGSITPTQIAEALTEAVGHPVDRREIEASEPIRQVGQHTIVVRLARTLSAKVTISVEAEE
ncbi:MAG: 50S ribosomal protein L9 [Chloroflexi bacterium]|nr:50S ribosomal protein L9 [Chloroflexota bacterium]